MVKWQVALITVGLVACVHAGYPRGYSIIHTVSRGGSGGGQGGRGGGIGGLGGGLGEGGLGGGLGGFGGGLGLGGRQGGGVREGGFEGLGGGRGEGERGGLGGGLGGELGGEGRLGVTWELGGRRRLGGRRDWRGLGVVSAAQKAARASPRVSPPRSLSSRSHGRSEAGLGGGQKWSGGALRERLAASGRSSRGVRRCLGGVEVSRAVRKSVSSAAWQCLLAAWQWSRRWPESVSAPVWSVRPRAVRKSSAGVWSGLARRLGVSRGAQEGGLGGGLGGGQEGGLGGGSDGGLGGGSYGGQETGKSYAYFQGPVIGKVQEVRGTVTDKHGKKIEVVDYIVILGALTLVVSVCAQGGGGLGGYGGHETGKSYAIFHGPVEGKVTEVHGSVSDHHGKKHEFIDYVAYPKYKFEYGVEDKHTGDYKQQKEIRDGDKVEGEYQLQEPGGNLRTVKYNSDHKAGFFASVTNHGGNEHVYAIKDKHGHEHQIAKGKSFVHYQGPVV
ncbi:Cuticle protein 8, partial [Gryllus bimaculatus]